jgi:hypothetical protein
VTKLLVSTCDLLRELETVAYELCKLALADPFYRRYLHSYISAAILMKGFDILSDRLSQF